MTYSTRLKVIETAPGHQLMCEIRHPMESGDRRDKATGRLLPANYITQVVFRVNEEIRAEMLLGKYVSKNPVVGTMVSKLSDGDRIIVSWQDIAGDSGQASVRIK